MARPKCYQTGKEKFPSQFEVGLAIADADLNSAHHRRQRNREGATSSYECPFCKGWHKTSKTRKLDSISS